jgi:hypothetical protein
LDNGLISSVRNTECFVAINISEVHIQVISFMLPLPETTPSSSILPRLLKSSSTARARSTQTALTFILQMISLVGSQPCYCFLSTIG